jgi:hypothetical protein
MCDKKQTKRKLNDLNDDDETFEVIDLEKEEEIIVEKKEDDKYETVLDSSDSNDDDIVEVNDQEPSTSKKFKSAEEKPECKYGSSCYRKNPQHFDEFRHPNVNGL